MVPKTVLASVAFAFVDMMGFGSSQDTEWSYLSGQFLILKSRGLRTFGGSGFTRALGL
jgi:hypothetical protein